MPDLSEAKTRQALIDPALKKAGWDVANPDQVGLEIPVDGIDPPAWQRLEAKLKRLREAVMKTDQAWAAEIRRTRHIGDFSRWKDHDAHEVAFERLLRDLKVEDL